MTGRITPQKFASTYNVIGAAVGLITIVAPAANVNGIKVLAAWAHDNQGWGASVTRVMWKATAPTSERNKAAGTLAINSPSGQKGEGGFGYPLIIPPGNGLYAQSQTANANAGFGVEYEVL